MLCEWHLFFQLNPSAVGIANCSDWDFIPLSWDEIPLRGERGRILANEVRISSETVRRRFHPSLLGFHRAPRDFIKTLFVFRRFSRFFEIRILLQIKRCQSALSGKGPEMNPYHTVFKIKIEKYQKMI